MKLYKKDVKLYLLLLLTGITALLLPLYTFAAVESAEGGGEGRVIRIGYIDYKGFIDEQDDGSYYGYGVEYLEKVAEYTGWQYEYVYGTWQEGLERLKNKEIDLICTANYSQERDAVYDFSAQEIGVSQFVLYTAQDEENLYYEDFTGLEGQKIGLLEGSSNIDYFERYAEKNNFHYQMCLYDTDKEMEEALLRGEVIAIATEHMALHDDLRLVGRYGSDPYYFMTYEGNDDILESIDYAVSEIKSFNAGYDGDLHKKYYGKSAAEKTPLFTREEAEYIAQSGAITVGSVDNCFPVSAYDRETGEMTGLTVGIMELIADISGLNFVMKPIEPGINLAKALKEQQCDLAVGLIKSDITNDQALRLSKPFMNNELVIVIKKGEAYSPDKEQTLVVTESLIGMEEYIKEGLNCDIIYRRGNDECLQAVLDGEADIMLQNKFVISYWLQNPRYHNLDIVPAFHLDADSCVASLSSSDERLISVINKTMDVIPEESMEQLVMNHVTLKPYKASLGDVIYKYELPLAAIAVLVVLCMVLMAAVLIVRQRNLRQMNEKNRQLMEAICQADSANQAKSQFLSRMSHEIRTPMNAIVGLTDIAKRYLESPKRVAEYLNKISDASKILLNIVNDVLDMSAIESAKLKIGDSAFDFKQMLASLSALYYTQCRQKNIKFDLVLCEVTEEILIGDSMRMNQILLNLLSNALKFTEPGGHIKVVVTQKSKTEDKVFMRFDVADTGCGMDEEMQERVFKPFEQESAKTAIKYGGSGLGLSIAKNLIDLMHGTISVKSEMGSGTTFTVDMPFGYEESKQNSAAGYFSGMRALIVDEDKESAEFTSAILERMGIEHDCVASGAECMERLQQEEAQGKGYSLCFVDWKMPKMEGVEVTRKIRERYDKDAVIIIISAYDMNEAQEDAELAGANAFVAKPMFQSTVFNILMSLGGERYKKQAEKPKEYNFSGRKVLVAEDNTLNMEIAVDLLELVNAEVIQAFNGKECVNIFEASEPGSIDVILMDIQMPEMNGYEATKIIRRCSHPCAQTVPIFAMTANAFTEDVTASFSAGMNGHISKPIDTELLYSTLQKSFDKS